MIVVFATTPSYGSRRELARYFSFPLGGLRGALLDAEVLFEFGLGAACLVLKILYDVAFLEEGDAGGDVDGVLQVVARDEDGGTSGVVILFEQTFDNDLRRGVEEVERLVKNDQVGP